MGYGGVKGSELPNWAEETLENYATMKALSSESILTYVNALKAWVRCTGDLKPWEADEEEVRRAVTCISRGRSGNTTSLYLARLKTLGRFRLNTTPPSWRWVRVRLRRRDIRDRILSKDEVEALIRAARSAKMRALIALVYEGGLRISEALSLRVRDIQPFPPHGIPKGYVVTVRGKTGERSVLVVDALPYIREWLLVHPLPDPDMPLFPGSRVERQMSRRAAEVSFERIRRRAGVRKATWHTLRHTRATELASKLTESELRKVMGWTPSSKMVEVYVHLSGRDAVSSLAKKVYGLEPEEGSAPSSSIRPKVCPICGYVNPSTAKLCLNCGARLTMSEEEIEEERRRQTVLSKVMEALLDDEEAMKILKEALKRVLSRPSIVHEL